MNNLFQKYKNVADKLIPNLKNNDFLNSGMLTKEEFIIAGNYLTQNYNEWIWEKADSKIPYLIFKNIQYKNINDFIIDDNINNNDDDEWNIYTRENNSNTNTNTKTNITKDTDTVTEVYQINQKKINNDNIDLMEFEEELDNEDDDAIISNSELLQNHQKKKYDITITYDNYYRTPRIWFHAYDYYNHPIHNEEILKDFSLEHTNVSVTIETHPYYNLECISVHPCKHAEAMKKLIKIELENDQTVDIKQYFIYFLKFVSCIFPNIIFDFTTKT